MTHIALFLPDLNGGGAERGMLTLPKYFVERGHRVDLVLARAEGALLPLLPPTVRLVDLRAGWRSWGLLGLAVSAMLRLAAYLRRERPDTLLSTLTGANLVAVLARAIGNRDTKLVLREAVTLKNIQGSFRLYLMRWLYPKADVVVALTEVMRRELITIIRIHYDKVVRIPNPIDLDFILNKAAIPFEHPWFFQNEPPVVIGIGRLSPQKDFSTLIHAFAQLRSGFKSRLVILGEGPLRGELESLVKELKLDGDVILPGFDDNPYRWLSRAKVFVLSSLWEGYPNVVLEALALGKLVVMTGYDSSVEIFADNSFVIIVPPSNPTIMANAIIEALNRQTCPNILLAPADSHFSQVALEYEKLLYKY